VDRGDLRMISSNSDGYAETDAISVECEYRHDGNISFNFGRGEIRINIPVEDEAYSIAIASSSINHLSASRTEYALVFELNTPPSYEQEQELIFPQDIWLNGTSHYRAQSCHTFQFQITNGLLLSRP
jgi:hypothetical protein